MARILRKIFFH
jgi:hypothetical protein